MMKLLLFLFIHFIVLTTSTGQTGYTSWRTGAVSSIETQPISGIVLAGGGADNDHAMRWMLQRANGGDVVVLRTSGSDGYNNYFFSQLGVQINSVESLRITSRAGANDPYVEQRIREAELIFIAGGDQTTYYNNWRGTKAHEAITYLIEEKQITIGGTSAGMAVLSECFYIPQNQGIISTEALTNPFHINMQTIGYGDFINIPILKSTITDTHFDQRNRAGRLMTFMAIMENSNGLNSKGIALNERTAVCIDDNGLARVFGRSNRNDTYAYFLQSNCAPPNSGPEVCLPGTPLTWNQNQEAVKVYAILGDDDGTHTFNLNNWKIGTGGQWWDWYVIEGLLRMKPSTTGICEIASGNSEIIIEEATFHITPNPANNEIFIKSLLPFNGRVQVYQTNGALIHHQLHRFETDSTLILDSTKWISGLYHICIYNEQSHIPACHKIIRE
jgi:cyanophycinase